MDILQNYQALIKIDSILKNYTPAYPFQINESAKYTQHQIKLYQANYCHTEMEPTKEQPSVVGGATTNIILIDL